MHFKTLCLHGFKSFVDRVELAIEPGVTGIVGPNGCGKSNIIEALRWVMGEGSAKRMRGAEMDDVIFGGAAGRAARNLAEVTVTLDNSGPGATAQFGAAEELVITRRIERERGSIWRINGQDVRARDVQLLFADMATGANSNAIVSQGRIGALIAARPAERRALLEEAAGIRGLHSRRHEAELRLRGAEANLERLDDVIGTMDAQADGLQRQLRQANRYRKVAEQLRVQEALLLCLRHRNAEAALQHCDAELHGVMRDVETRTGEAARIATQLADMQATLPALRNAAAETAAAAQNLRIRLQELEREETRIATQRSALAERRRQIESDLDRERQLAGDAERTLAELTRERDEITAARARESDAAEAARTARGEVEAALAEKEALMAESGRRLTAATAARAALRDRLEGVEKRRLQLADRGRELDAAVADLAAEEHRIASSGEAGDGDTAAAAEATARTRLAEAEEVMRAREEALRTAGAQRTELRERVAQAEADIRRAEAARAQAAQARMDDLQARARARLGNLEKRQAALSAEATALTRMLPVAGAGEHPPVMLELVIDPGYEAALGAALGDDLAASLAPGAPTRWTDPPAPGTGDPPPLPEGVGMLADHVVAPAALLPRLRQVGVVPDAATGARLMPALRPGQRLVGRDGGLWRWDGLVRAPDATDSGARQLTQRNRLMELRAELDACAGEIATCKASGDEALASLRAEMAAEHAAAGGAEQAQLADHATRLKAAGEEETALESAAHEARAAFRAAATELDQIRDRAAEHHALLSDLAARSKALAREQERLAAEVAENDANAATAGNALAAQEDVGEAEARLDAVRRELTALRERRMVVAGADERFAQAEETRTRREAVILRERGHWQERLAGAQARAADLHAREARLGEEQASLAARPEEIATQRLELQELLDAAATRMTGAAEELAGAEAALQDADKARRLADLALAESREARARLEVERDQAAATLEQITAELAEQPDIVPEQVLREAGMDGEPGSKAPLPEAVRERIARLRHERERIGPVNLRAAEEAEELAERIALMRSEQQDLTAAITRLRDGIGALNREGRARLAEAFTHVDGHFQKLFSRLFGGGEAKLSLSREADPLEAGLEIMARPPGKKMQVLSLLSGGEQALTALALLFAAFLTNPAPICILDEVDAPLDDANVDRFCGLLDEISHAGSTRFLIVTHHRMTMARVDRLFGVTMAERGVSQLVSVDLRAAEHLRESA